MSEYAKVSGVSAVDLDIEDHGIASDVEEVDLELLEDNSVHQVLKALQPDAIYNLAAQSFVGLSFASLLRWVKWDGPTAVGWPRQSM